MPCAADCLDLTERLGPGRRFQGLGQGLRGLCRLLKAAADVAAGGGGGRHFRSHFRSHLCGAVGGRMTDVGHSLDAFDF